jgi:serine/threonine protein kinase
MSPATSERLCAPSASSPVLACHTHHVDITEIAGYRVIRQLGAGGMGQVFLVQHPTMAVEDPPARLQFEMAPRLLT